MISHAAAYNAAREEIGTWEWRDGDNPKILGWFSEVGHSWVQNDETAWCAAFIGAMLEKGGLPSTRKLNARSYLEWGEPVPIDKARMGDVMVFSRGDPKGWQGHVAFFVKREGDKLHVLGGNQANQVNVAKYPVSRLLGVRRWKDGVAT